MRLNFCCVIAMSVLAALSNDCVDAKGYYTIIAPTTLTENRLYEVSVATHEADENYEFKISLSGPSYNHTNSAELPPDTLLDVEFEIPKLEQGEYHLKTDSSTKTLLYRNSSVLRIKDAPIYAFEELERNEYQPGEIMKFRAFLFDGNFLPLDIKDDIRVILTKNDGGYIKVKHLNVVDKGLITGFAQLPDSEGEHMWHLDMYMGDRIVLKSGFSVGKVAVDYFNVRMTAPPRVSIKDPQLPIIIKSDFHGGHPVEGTVKLKIDIKCHSDYEKSLSAPSIHKTIDMRLGQAEINIDLSSHKEFVHHDAYCNMEINAEVQALHMPYIKTAYASSVLSYNQHKVDSNNSPLIQYFEPNQVFEICFSIILGNGSPDIKKLATLIITQEIMHYKYPLDDPQPDDKSMDEAKHVKLQKYQFLGYPNENGEVAFKVSLPSLKSIKGFKNQFRTEILYDGELLKLNKLIRQNGTDNLFDFERFEELYGPPKANSMEIHVDGKYQRYQINEKYNCSIYSTVSFKYITYNLISHGRILQSQRVDFKQETTDYNMILEINSAMFPKLYIYAYFIDANGNFHYGERSLPIELNFTNHIEVVAPAEAVPGSQISLKIKTTPNARVTLLAFDERINRKSKQQLEKLRSLQHRLSDDQLWRPYRDYVSYYPGSNSGVYTITNAHYDFQHKKYNYGNQNEDELASEYDLYENAKLAYEMVLPNQNRQTSSQTFEFLDIKSSKSGEFEWNVTVPNLITNWMITATSWNPEFEIGMAEQFLELKVTKPFIIEVFTTEKKIKQGDEIKITVRLSNNHSEDLDVSVELENNEGFEFIENTAQSRHLSSNSVDGIYWTLRAKEIGRRTLRISAESSFGKEVVETDIRVLPEGNIAPVQTRTFGIHLIEKPDFQEVFEPEIPEDAIPNSQHIQVMVNANFLIIFMASLEEATKKQAVNNVEIELQKYIINHLLMKSQKSKKALTGKGQKKLQKTIELSYEKLLTYRLKDGSFKKFENGTSGSIYWTANVLLNLASHAKDQEDHIIKEGLSFLANCQSENGHFVNQDESVSFQGKPMDEVVLTAFVMLLFLEKDHSYAHQLVVKKGLAYLKDQQEGLKDAKIKDLVELVLSKSISGEFTRSADYRRVVLGHKPDTQSACWCHFYENEISQGLCALDETFKNYEQNDNLSITLQTTGLEPITEVIRIDNSSSDFFILEMPLGTKSVTISAKGSGMAIVLVTSTFYTKTNPS